MKFDYEKGNPVFDEFLKDVCKKIRGRKHRDEVREELLGHLAENFERNTALGMSEEGAAEAAVKRMGDSAEIAEQFGEVYKVPLSKQIKTTLGLFLLGIPLMSFRFDFLREIGQPAYAAGAVLVLLGLFRIHKLNRKTEASFKIFLFLLVWNIIRDCIRFNFFTDDLRVYLNLITFAVTTAFYIALFLGISEKCGSLKRKNQKSPHFIPWILLMSISIYITSIIEEADEIFIFLFPSFIFCLILLLNLWRARKILSGSAKSFALRQSLKKHEIILFAASAALLIVLLPLSVQVLSATRQPAAEPYIKADSEYSAEELQAARKHAEALGLPSEYLDDLPDSEVILYRDAIHIGTTRTPAHTDIHTGETLSAHIIYFDRGKMRILYRIDGFAPDKLHYRDGFYMVPEDRDCFVCDMTDAQPFKLILSEKNGAAYKNKPIFEKELSSAYDYCGCEFAFLKGSRNRRAYFAVTTYLRSWGSHPLYTSLDHQYFRKLFPFYPDYYNTLEAAHEMYGKAYTKTFRSKVPSYNMPNGYIGNVLILPEYTNKAYVPESAEA